jgi:monofunctional biosynthetic peptidoglycan transglycosylase
MTSRRSISYLKAILYLSLLLLILVPGLMYFSHDVAKLNSLYPHLLRNKMDVRVELNQSKPKNWTELKKMSKFARWSIILSEDWSFYDHEGIDLEQIKVALNEMVEDKKFRGASTITQQMVKNVFLSDERTLWRKIHEGILTYKVEKNLSKNKILEIYLNVIEFGPGIYGMKEAARHYFKKHPSEITPREGAFLAMLLPSPKRYYVSFRKKELTRFARARVRAILEKMRMGKVITPEQYILEIQSKFSWEK